MKHLSITLIAFPFKYCIPDFTLSLTIAMLILMIGARQDFLVQQHWTSFRCPRLSVAFVGFNAFDACHYYHYQPAACKICHPGSALLLQRSHSKTSNQHIQSNVWAESNQHSSTSQLQNAREYNRGRAPSLFTPTPIEGNQYNNRSHNLDGVMDGKKRPQPRIERGTSPILKKYDTPGLENPKGELYH